MSVLLGHKGTVQMELLPQCVSWWLVYMYTAKGARNPQYRFTIEQCQNSPIIVHADKHCMCEGQ